MENATSLLQTVLINTQFILLFIVLIIWGGRKKKYKFNS